MVEKWWKSGGKRLKIKVEYSWNIHHFSMVEYTCIPPYALSGEIFQKQEFYI